MILYKNNSKLKLKTVTTVQGDTEYRRNCKCIGNLYYLIDRDVFNIEGRWYRIDGGNIIYNYSENRWVHKREIATLTKGVVAYKAGEYEVGYFNPNPYNNGLVRTNRGTQKCMSIDYFKELGFVECVISGILYPKQELSASNIKKLLTIRNEKSHTSRGYNIEDNPEDFSNKTKYYQNYPTEKMAKYLTDITFGAEIEISHGSLPEYIQNRNGVVICRDGSIDGGPELVTIPLSGAKGLQTLANIGKELKTRGNININCSYHLHIGSIRTDKTFIAAMYILGRKIQDEMFTMFPYYKTDHRGFKRKNYNRKLEALGIHILTNTSDKEIKETYLLDVYARIFDFLVESKIPLSQFNNKTREHPESRKWERNNRYTWLNMMNMFFTHRNTVEFRLHTPTTNPIKLTNWLFICNAIVKYVEKYADQIISNKQKISLKEVFDIYKDLYPKDSAATALSNYIYNYFLQRSEDFRKDFDKKDFLSEWDMTTDKEYTFEHGGIKSLF